MNLLWAEGRIGQAEAPNIFDNKIGWDDKEHGEEDSDRKMIYNYKWLLPTFAFFIITF